MTIIILDLIFCVAALGLHQRGDPPRHGVTEVLEDVLPLAQVGPGLLDPGLELLPGGGSGKLAHFILQEVPGIFYWIHVGGLGRPINHLDVIVLLEPGSHGLGGVTCSQKHI